MKLGFVSAILPDLALEEVLAFANAEGFDCVELMCWPKGKAERRYAGVTHVDVADARRGRRRPRAPPARRARASRSAASATTRTRSPPTRPRRRSTSST